MTRVADRRAIPSDTIEDRLLELQEKKRVLAKAALANDPEAKNKLNKLSERDLMYLFSTPRF